MQLHVNAIHCHSVSCLFFLFCHCAVKLFIDILRNLWNLVTTRIIKNRFTIPTELSESNDKQRNGENGTKELLESNDKQPNGEKGTKELSESNDKQRNGEKGTKEQSMIFKILHRIYRSSNTKSTKTEGELWCPEIISSFCMLH